MKDQLESKKKGKPQAKKSKKDEDTKAVIEGNKIKIPASILAGVDMDSSSEP